DIFANFLEAEFFNEKVDLFPPLLLCIRTHFENRKKIFLHSKLPEHRRFLRQVSKPFACSLVHWKRSDLFVVKKNLAFIGFNKTHDHVKGCCLTSAIGSQEPHDFTLLNMH